MLKLLKVATPVVDVLTDLVPTSVPVPDASEAVTLYSSDEVFVSISVFEYLSCKVTVGGGVKTTAMNLSIRSSVGTLVNSTLLGTP